MIPAEAFQSHSLRLEPMGEAVTRILAAAIATVDAREVINKAVSREGDTLNILGEKIALPGYRQIHLLGIGKASIGMSSALIETLGGNLSHGLIITKQRTELNQHPSNVTILEGDHPVPGNRSEFAGRKVKKFLGNIDAQDLLFCLLSGGGSALVTSPVKGMRLADLQALTTQMLGSGATIQEINSLRRRLDRLKGGGITTLANGASIFSLILSDVVGDPLEAIASGPTSPDPFSNKEALAILEKYDLIGKLPPSVLTALETTRETPKPGDRLFQRTRNIVVGNNQTAANGAVRQAALEGFNPHLLRTDLGGEAREAALDLAAILRQTKITGNPSSAPACLIVGGETTVTMKNKGKGGRNTELALAAVRLLAGIQGVMLITLATDGEDGPTDAAGAVVTGTTHERAKEMGMRVEEYLSKHNSYPFFERLGDLIQPGSTGTNVNDLNFLFTF